MYLELSGLTEELEGIIVTLYGVYAKYKTFEMGGHDEKYLSHITMPRTISLEIPMSLTLLYIGNHIDELYPKVINEIRFNRLEANVRDIHVLLSCCCAIYHIMNNLSVQKDRFKRIDKELMEVMNDVLVSRGH